MDKAVIVNKQNFKNAFKCHKCPGNNGESGCPMWWEYPQEDKDGNVRVMSHCGYTALPFFLRHVATASNRPAEEIGKMKTEIVKGLSHISANLIPLIEQKLVKNDE